MESQHISFEDISLKKHKNDHIVKVVQEMLRAEGKKVLASDVVHKVKYEYLMCTGKPSGQSLDSIIETYHFMRQKQLAVQVLQKSFFVNDRVKNFGIKVLLDKITVCETKTRVLLRFYAVGESQLCEKCYNRYKSSKDAYKAKVDYVVSECEVEPQLSYWFNCTYICDYCFINKLYIEL